MPAVDPATSAFFPLSFKSIGYRQFFDHQGIAFLSRRNWPVRSRGASVASHVTVSAPCWTVRGAFAPPISVLTQPGHTEFTVMFLSRNAAANWRVTALSAVLEIL